MIILILLFSLTASAEDNVLSIGTLKDGFKWVHTDLNMKTTKCIDSVVSVDCNTCLKKECTDGIKDTVLDLYGCTTMICAVSTPHDKAKWGEK